MIRARLLWWAAPIGLLSSAASSADAPKPGRLVADHGAPDITKKLSETSVHPGFTARVCAGQAAPGWVVQDVETNFVICGKTFDDIWVIINLNNASSGTSYSVCAAQSFPSGWLVSSTETNFTRCGRNPSQNNIAVIRKL